MLPAARETVSHADGRPLRRHVPPRLGYVTRPAARRNRQRNPRPGPAREPGPAAHWAGECQASARHAGAPRGGSSRAAARAQAAQTRPPPREPTASLPAPPYLTAGGPAAAAAGPRGREARRGASSSRAVRHSISRETRSPQAGAHASAARASGRLGAHAGPPGAQRPERRRGSGSSPARLCRLRSDSACRALRLPRGGRAESHTPGRGGKGEGRRGGEGGSRSRRGDRSSRECSGLACRRRGNF